MNTISYEQPGDTWHDDELDGGLPGRPRRRWLTPWSALLLALVTAAIGFYVGIRIEKGQVAGSSTGGAAGLASRFARLTGASGTSGATGGARSGGARGGGGFPGFAGAGAFGGGTAGSVASVNGKTVYVTETSGNTVKVKLSSATKLTKSETVGRSKINPGDRVLISGVTGSGGTISATSVTDSGSSGGSAGPGASGSGSSSSSSGSGSSSSSSSSVSSLFGG